MQGTSWVSLADAHGFVYVGGEAIQWTTGRDALLLVEEREWSPSPSHPVWHGGQWLLPEVQTDATSIVCDWERALPADHGGLELAYIQAAVDRLGTMGFDTTRVFFTGCSMGSALTVWLAQCYHQKYPTDTTAFGSQSTGLKEKGDGINLPRDDYDPDYQWGECPNCQYFPAPAVKTDGLKACVVDQTGDNGYYLSSLALHKKWAALGMRTNLSISSGGHCETDSFEWIANCLDDGTGRLLGGEMAK